MYIWWIFLFLAYKTVADESGSELTNSSGIFQVETNTKNIGRIKYRDGEVVIIQNQQQHTDFFFTPFPYLEGEETQCHKNVLNGRIELGLQVEFYTPQLIQAVKDYLYKYQSSLCGNTTSSSMCNVSLLPMHSIRLVQRSSRLNSTHHMYTLEDSWQPATQLPQSMEFIIYASNMTVCEELREALTAKCRLPNFEVHYSLQGEQTIQRQLEVNTQHITSTPIYNQIRAQFPSVETVFLMENDFQVLVNESIDRVTMTLRTQEGFKNLEDSMGIDKLLKQQLSTKQVQLKMINDKLWENLYWTQELTRPDRLAKVLNSIVRKESGSSEYFVYDSQAAKDAMKADLTQHDTSEVDQSRHDIDHFNLSKQYGDRAHLTHHDKQRLQQLDKLFDSYSRSSSSSNARSDDEDVSGGFEFFGLFKIGGGSSGATQTRSESSDNQADVSDKQHENVSDVDILNETTTDKHNLNVLGIRRNHLNTTEIDKERSTNTRTNNNNLNEMKTNTNNLTVTKIDKDTNKQYTFSRNDVDKFLRELSNNVYLAGDIINPRPINARLVNIGKISTNTKLFSNPVLVRMRSNVHALPLRCKPGDNGGKSKLWLTDRVDRMENVLLNLSNHVVEITKLLHGEIRNVQDKISELRNKTEETITNWKQEMDTALRKINVQTDHLYTNLTDMVKQAIKDTSSKINVPIDNLNRNLTNTNKQDTKWKQHGITINTGNYQENKLSKPCGIFIDDDQNIYVADQYNHRIVEWKYNATIGQIVAGGNENGNQINQLNYPRDVIIDKENNSLIIADSENRRVMRWSLENNTKNGEIIISNIDCAGLTMDKDGSFYVSDWKKDEVRRWKRGDKKGTIVAGGNGGGNHLNQLNFPTYIFIDKDYSLYVSDWGNHRVMKWLKDAKEGIVVAGGNGKGNSLTQLYYPTGVIVDQLSQIYVADWGNHRVMSWCKGAKEGTIVVGGNRSGQQSNQLNFPAGLSFDRQGNLYVVDQWNNRIQKFEMN